MIMNLKIPESVCNSIVLYEKSIQDLIQDMLLQETKNKMSLDVSKIFHSYQPTARTKQDVNKVFTMVDKKSLVKVTDFQEIKVHQKQSFDYILDQIEDPNIQGFIANKCYLAGGCIRNFIMGIPVKDLDIYFRTEEYANLFRDLWIKRKYSSERIFKKDISCVADTYNALTFRDIVTKPDKIPFQFVVKTGGTPEKVVFETFDFENCMGWYDPVSDTIDISVMMRSLNSGELVYNSKTIDPLNSIRRVIKFQKMGFEITERCLFDMFKQSKERTVDEQFKRYKFGREANY